QLISALLTHAGFTVQSVNSAEAAWEWLQNNPAPNLILSDIIMEGESGLDLCRKVKNDDKLKEIPLLFCSSKSEEFDRFWALRQGGDEYITKPYVPQKLVDTVCQFVN
ncbi:MAG: response regulator, partial [Cyanobacteria bacterium J083]